MPEPESPPPVLVVVRDLLFLSRIRAVAASGGAPIRVIRDPGTLADSVGRSLIVDLNQDGTLEAAAAWGRSTGNPVIGFVSHVDSATIALARAAGIQQVLSRSGFVEHLPQLLR